MAAATPRHVATLDTQPMGKSRAMASGPCREPLLLFLLCFALLSVHFSFLSGGTGTS